MKSATARLSSKSSSAMRGASMRSLDEAFKFQRIVDSVGSLVVIEIYIDRSKSTAPLSDPVRPTAELLGRIAALVFAARPVQAHVGPVGRNDGSRLEAVKFVNAERRVVTAQQVVNVVPMPGRLPEFGGVAMFVGEGLEKRLKSPQVPRPVRRELEQDGSELLLQGLGARDE